MNEQNKKLTQGLRYQIFAYRNTGMALREIANLIGVHFNRVSRELRQNALQTQYDPETPHTLK